MNRIQRPPVINQGATTSAPKFGRPQVNQPEKRVEDVNKVVNEEQVESVNKVVNEPKENTPKPSVYLDDFKTKEFTVENSITVKIKDNYYKFQASETKTAPETATDYDVGVAKKALANKLNEFLDEQIADLLESFQ